MIHSMTAFARAHRGGEWGSLTCELRTINHRYLEMSLHLPDSLRVLDMPLREKMRHHLKRGKIECAIRYQPSAGVLQSLLSVNTDFAQALCRASETIAGLLKTSAPVNPCDILRFQGVMQSQEASIESLQPHVFSLMDQALEELTAAREREGEELKRLFLQRMDLIQNELTKVRGHLPGLITEQRERLMKRFNDAKIELDAGRLEQEMVMFVQKIDVAEEIDRTDTHVAEVRRVLEHGGTVGRRLDFLMQELNREANTLGSKSVDTLLTHAAVEMKVLIEQVREQVQNIE